MSFWVVRHPMVPSITHLWLVCCMVVSCLATPCKAGPLDDSPFTPGIFPDQRGRIKHTTTQSNKAVAEGSSFAGRSRYGGTQLDFEDAENEGTNDIAVPSPNRINDMPRLPPMAGFAQTMNSAAVKQFLLELQASEVAVMFQTGMMVENGGTSGFLGALNVGGGLLSSAVQSQQLQLKLFDAAASQDVHSQAYVQRWYNLQKEKGDTEGVWPAALLGVSGDELKAGVKRTGRGQPRQFATEPDSNISVSQGFTSEKSATGAAPAEATLLDNMYRLLDTEPSDQQEVLDEYKELTIDWVGDVKFEDKVNKDLYTVESRPILVAPREKRTVKVAGKNVEIRGHPLRLRAQTDDAWKSLHKVLWQICQFRVTDPNYQYARDTLGGFKLAPQGAQVRQEDWEGIQSVNLGLTMNHIDQLFKVVASRRPLRKSPGDDQCNRLFGPSGDREFPSFAEPKEADYRHAAGDGSASLDKCGDGAKADKPCVKDVVLFKIARFIGYDRTESFYLDLARNALNRSTLSPAFNSYTTDLFCGNLRLGVPCDPVQVFKRRIESNQERWRAFHEKLSKVAQGLEGASILRPGSSSITSSFGNNVGGNTK